MKMKKKKKSRRGIFDSSTVLTPGVPVLELHELVEYLFATISHFCITSAIFLIFTITSKLIQ